MLFHEIYGIYFHVVAEILSEAVQHRLTEAQLNAMVQEKAFAESSLTIPTALRKGWPLLREDLSTPLHHIPSMPLTTLQKRWLKTLLQDAKIRLFAPNTAGLENVEPLFDWKDVIYFDQYSDGDPYEEAQYIENFRTVMKAIHEHRSVRVTYRGTSNETRVFLCTPNHMEYSEKDDKFRVIASKSSKLSTLNMSRIVCCELLEPVQPKGFLPGQARQCALTFRLKDERNALNRALLHFSHFEKETVKLSDKEYEVSLKYDREDETELLIRILSFGPMVKVVAPERFITLMRERLEKQNRLISSKLRTELPFSD